ncbi:hypothetical protein [Pantanalinema sp. GBBB05]|uniref:hypothetical protein n=1 Tax=Pantanalinema sp. GBBB05 TaxID=2604139 RepID=UPI001E008DA4|nr:hypothetical protein [Pantanalinema sp. GBBB05]
MHDNDLDSAYCTLHNLGASLRGNQQCSDIEWLARVLFENSRLGAGDISTVPWLIDVQQWDYLMLEPQAMLGNGPHHWQALTDEQREAWRKLARICLYVLPSFASRVGSRYMEQARALQQVWRQEQKQDIQGGGEQRPECPSCHTRSLATIPIADGWQCGFCHYEWEEG